MEFAYNAKNQILNFSRKLFLNKSVPTTLFGIPKDYTAGVHMAIMGALLLIFAFVLVKYWILIRSNRRFMLVDRLNQEVEEDLQREQDVLRELMQMGDADGHAFADLTRRVLVIANKLEVLEDMLDELETAEAV